MASAVLQWVRPRGVHDVPSIIFYLQAAMMYFAHHFADIRHWHLSWVPLSVKESVINHAYFSSGCCCTCVCTSFSHAPRHLHPFAAFARPEKGRPAQRKAEVTETPKTVVQSTLPQENGGRQAVPVRPNPPPGKVCRLNLQEGCHCMLDRAGLPGDLGRELDAFWQGLTAAYIWLR